MLYRLSDRSSEEWYDAIDAHLSSAFSAALCFAPSAGWHEDGRFTRFVSGVPDPFGNIVWNARLHETGIDGEIGRILDPIVSRDVPGIWIVGPTSEPAGLKERLLAAGLVPGPGMEAMAVDLDRVAEAPMPDGVLLEEVCDDAAMSAWIEVLAAGYEIAPEVAAAFGCWPRHLGYSSRSKMRAFLAREGARPVACSLVYLHDGVAGIYCVATAPGARRRGIGRAMTVAPLLEARAAGYRTAVLQASAAGESIYRRIGFDSFGPIAMMVRLPADAQGAAIH
ncbi:MAG TPA: GNAT family N-acetyltransferase [Chthonomonadaceae bacterium]|nr:GNAT family N-acetyltransferase [Chthonomonadaceae bacterium]